MFLRSTARGPRPAYRGQIPGANDTGTSASALLVLAQVFESEAPLLRQGQKVRVRFPSLGAREWTGTVTSLETQISQTTHTLQFRVSVDAEGASVPGGMTAVVTVEADPVSDALLVPREAVIVTGKGARVIVAQGGGRFQPRKVEAEDVGEDEIVIRSGLKEGERVVVSAQFMLDSEANLHAGLDRLSGGEPSGNMTAEPAMHGGAMPNAAMPAATHMGAMHDMATHEQSAHVVAMDGATHDAAMPAGNIPEGPVPPAVPPEPATPRQDTSHEGTMR